MPPLKKGVGGFLTKEIYSLEMKLTLTLPWMMVRCCGYAAVVCVMLTHRQDIRLPKVEKLVDDGIVTKLEKMGSV